MEKIVFSKYSNERANKFAIRTDIYKKDSLLFVKKIPCSPAASGHVNSLFKWYGELSALYEGTKFKINVCRLVDNYALFDFISGNTLEEVLDRFIEQKDYQGLEKTFNLLISLIRNTATEHFQPTDQFNEIFGAVDFEKDMPCAPVTDIDMVVNNIIVNDGWNLIDYEWTFDFPIPIEYAVFRVLHYYFKITTARLTILHKLNLYERFGITKPLYNTFMNMELKFQEYIIENHKPLRLIQPRITPGAIHINTMLESYHKNGCNSVQVFWSKDGIIRETDSINLKLSSDNILDTELELIEDVRTIRLDPGENPCILKIHDLQINHQPFNLLNCRLNGIYSGKNWIFFKEPDPWVILETGETLSSFKLHIEIISLSNTAVVFFQEYEAAALQREALISKQESLLQNVNQKILEKERLLNEKNEILAERNQTISAMENTKLWKAYSKYQHFKKGSKK